MIRRWLALKVLPKKRKHPSLCPKRRSASFCRLPFLLRRRKTISVCIRLSCLIGTSAFPRCQRAQSSFKPLEEWKKLSFTHLSDTLFVVVTYLFTTLLQSYVGVQSMGKAYQGKIAPRNIGRRKDFWNRLDMAYNDCRFSG